MRASAPPALLSTVAEAHATFSPNKKVGSRPLVHSTLLESSRSISAPPAKGKHGECAPPLGPSEGLLAIVTGQARAVADAALAQAPGRRAELEVALLLSRVGDV